MFATLNTYYEDKRLMQEGQNRSAAIYYQVVM